MPPWRGLLGVPVVGVPQPGRRTDRQPARPGERNVPVGGGGTSRGGGSPLRGGPMRGGALVRVASPRGCALAGALPPREGVPGGVCTLDGDGPLRGEARAGSVPSRVAPTGGGDAPLRRCAPSGQPPGAAPRLRIGACPPLPRPGLFLPRSGSGDVQTEIGVRGGN